MEKMFYEERPLSYETIRSVGVMSTVIRFGINQTADGWECKEVCVNHTEPLVEADYGRLVAAIVRSRYSSDDVEAIIQNYLSDKTTEHMNEFDELQQWRAEAKRLARTIINNQ